MSGCYNNIKNSSFTLDILEGRKVIFRMERYNEGNNRMVKQSRGICGKQN